MEHLFTYLHNFKSEEKKFDNDLDTLYYNSLLKGQQKGEDILGKMFPEKDHVLNVKDVSIVKNEVDSYLAQRKSLATENREVEYKTENDGFYSGIIQILNEAYIYLLRYSSQQARESIKAEESKA